MSDSEQYFKNKIRFWRRYRDMTQMQLAMKIPCAPSTISYYEHGFYDPPQNIRARISEVLQVAQDELFEEAY